MTATSTLHQLALEAVAKDNLNDFPALKQQLRDAVNAERHAAHMHMFSLKIDKGGIKEITVYFDTEQGNEPDEWLIADGPQAFFNGIEVTDLFDSADLDEEIYSRSNEVEQQMADAWADHMIDQYEASRD